MKKFFCLLSVCLLCVCMISPVQAFAYDLPNGLDTDDVVTFGVYDHETGALVQSEPVEFGNYFITGLAHSIYEDNYDLCSQYGLTEEDLYNYLQTNTDSNLTTLKQAALNGWLFDVFHVDSYYWNPKDYQYVICGVRIPATNGHPSLEFSDGDVSGTYSWEFLPSGSSYFLLHSNANSDVNHPANYAYAAIGGSYPYKNYTANAVTVLSDLINSQNISLLQDPTVSICYLPIRFFINSSGFTLNFEAVTYHSDFYCGSNDSNSSCYVPYGCGGVLYKHVNSNVPISLEYPLLSVFPFYNSDYVHITSNDDLALDLPPIDVFYPTSSLTNIYLSTYQNVTPDPSGSPRPWITPTPIIIEPIPTFAPVDGRVDPFVGLEQMFDGLLARSYQFSYNGVDFTINPFYLFICCIILGLVVRLFVGGSHE